MLQIYQLLNFISIQINYLCYIVKYTKRKKIIKLNYRSYIYCRMSSPLTSQFFYASTSVSRVPHPLLLLIKINDVLFQSILQATTYCCLSDVYKVMWFILSYPDEI